MRKLSTLLFILSCLTTYAQVDSIKLADRKKENAPLKPLKYLLNEDGSTFIQFAGLVQTWVRFNGSNPGTTVNGGQAPRTFDIGIRRVRFQLIGQLTDRIFFYSQFGMNSFSYLSQRKFGFFIHDALGDYAIVPKKLSLGAGLGSWIGPLRFSSPAVASLMGYDAPLFQQTTNDLNDQFVRRPLVYAKGKLGKLDYRVSVSKPLLVNPTANPAIPGGQASVSLLGTLPNEVSTFSVRDPNPQFNGYFSYQFLDQEANALPYATGTYFGAKKIFNLGGGVQYQNQAMWHKKLNTTTGTVDTVSTSYLTGGVDVIYDAPLNKNNGTAISLYASWLYSDYGPNYIRNFAPMNPADGRSIAGGYYNSGGGASFPINGTGNTMYAQAGYKFKNNLLGNSGTLMPYVLTQWSKYNNFQEWMITYDVGINWLLKGHNSKFTLNYGNRPFYLQKLATDPVVQYTRRGTLILQYQVSF
jgi:hypothetical protein